MTSTKPFEVRIPEAEIADLRARLRNTRWADDFGNDDWHYGVERGWLRDMVDYWANDYDWRAEEAEINRLTQYRTEIDRVPIHFVHVRGKGPNPKPIILTHGWPWTFWDWKEVILRLSDPAAYGGNAEDAFDVVVPSLPGFGFSVPLRTVHIGPREIAGLWVKLMQDVLGYGKFAAAGGDFGALVTSDIGHLYPEAVTGIYLTLAMMPGLQSRLPFPKEAFAPDEAWMFERGIEVRPKVSSHTAVQRYDPQTLAYAMADSPVGTAAWIWQRRHDWSDCGEDVLSVYGRDFLCTTASIYWFNKSLGSSFRVYSELHRKPWVPVHDRKPIVPVPSGLAVFPKDLIMVPRAVMEENLNMQRYTIMDRGGHFGPFEHPEGVTYELREFFRELV